MIVPPRIPQIRLPAPKHPPILLLIDSHLCIKPLLKPRDISAVDQELWIVLVRHDETPLAHHDGPVAAAVVGAAVGQVVGLCGIDAAEADVVVVVVGGEVVVRQILRRVARAPEGVHHEDVEVVV